MDASGIQDYLIELYPWARVYKTALKQENTLILPLARTQNRENLFKWARPVEKTNQTAPHMFLNGSLKIFFWISTQHSAKIRMKKIVQKVGEGISH